ncbi:MAG: aldo/keto reductase [Clostridia bacterium]|nr:aldo/keto reductase [Clostridia bacterium]
MDQVNISKLGFGLMRLPRKGLFVDHEQVCSMVDKYLAAGGNYFDTAFIYPGSEAAIRQALVDRVPRDKYVLATKLNAALPPLQTAQAAKRQLDTSLERTNAGYFDYYLLHAIMDGNVSKYDRMKLWEYVQEQKAAGRIRHCGFSFHAGPETLDRLLREHPETEFVQLQINYADWESGNVQARANYEVARSYGKPIVIMEPVKGGKLANPPENVRSLFASVHPEWSCASWALRFAMGLDGVLTVLSGMSSTEQVEDNLKTMRTLGEMGDTEKKTLRQAQVLMGRSNAIPCTACKYCMEGCPKQLNIPGIMEAINLKTANGQAEDAKAQYAAVTVDGHTAGSCITCRKCESACPQHLPISDAMKKASELFD